MQTKDIISKKTIGHLAADIATLLLELNIDTDSVELLESEKHRVETRRADLVARMREQDTGQAFILHIEIQNNNDTVMPIRMMRYYTDIKLEWPLEPVQQYLIYIGRKPLNMPAFHQDRDFIYRYKVLDMHSVDCAKLLTRDTPEALVLAVLCDFKGRPEQEMVSYIVKRLHELFGDNEKGFRDYLSMLEILSENRSLQPHIKEAEKMLTEIKVENLPSFQIGLEQGLEDGKEEGVLQERLRLAKEFLGLLDDQTIADKTGLSLAEVQSLR